MEPKVYEYADELVHQLRQRLKSPVEIGRWFEYFTFDLMGLVGFNLKFNLLQTQKHIALDMYNAGHPVLGVVTPAPWLYHLTAAIPYGQEGYHMFARWAEGGLREKVKVIKTQPFGIWQDANLLPFYLNRNRPVNET